MVDILMAVREFYVIQATEALLATNGKFEPYRKSHERVYADFTDFSNRYVPQLARLIYDYTVKVCAGEMRHAGASSRYSLVEFDCSACSRSWTYMHCERYTDISLLKAGIAIFDEINQWNAGFGGEKWQKIAEAGLLYHRVPAAVFIDHCVDLTHNGSIYFDKGAGLVRLSGTQRYINFLDWKYIASPKQLISVCIVGETLYKILQRMANVGILDFRPHERHEGDTTEWEILEYEAIEWGTRTLSDKIEYGYHTHTKRRRESQYERVYNDLKAEIDSFRRWDMDTLNRDCKKMASQSIAQVGDTVITMSGKSAKIIHITMVDGKAIYKLDRRAAPVDMGNKIEYKFRTDKLMGKVVKRDRYHVGDYVLLQPHRLLRLIPCVTPSMHRFANSIQCISHNPYGNVYNMENTGEWYWGIDCIKGKIMEVGN